MESKSVIDYAKQWASDGALDEMATAALAQALNKHKERTATFLIAMAERKIHSITRMLRILDEIEDESLTNVARWRQASNAELIRMMTIIHKSINESLEFLMKLVTGNELDAKNALNILLSQTTVNVVGTNAPNPLAIPPAKRDMIRKLLMSIAQPVAERPIPLHLDDFTNDDGNAQSE